MTEEQREENYQLLQKRITELEQKEKDLNETIKKLNARIAELVEENANMNDELNDCYETLDQVMD